MAPNKLQIECRSSVQWLDLNIWIVYITTKTLPSTDSFLDVSRASSSLIMLAVAKLSTLVCWASSALENASSGNTKKYDPVKIQQKYLILVYIIISCNIKTYLDSIWHTCHPYLAYLNLCLHSSL